MHYASNMKFLEIVQLPIFLYLPRGESVLHKDDIKTNANTRRNAFDKRIVNDFLLQSYKNMLNIKFLDDVITTK